MANQGTLYGRFDAVVLLSVPVDVLLERVTSRTSNPFSKDPAERDPLIGDLATVEPLLRASAMLEIDATRVLADVADAVEALALGAEASG